MHWATKQQRFDSPDLLTTATTASRDFLDTEPNWITTTAKTPGRSGPIPAPSTGPGDHLIYPSALKKASATTFILLCGRGCGNTGLLDCILRK